MLRHFIGSRVFRVTVRGLIVLQISLMLPAPDGRYVLMAASRDVAQDTRDTPPAVTANRAVPRVPAPPSSLVFSSSPSSADIFRAHVFGEPLVPIGGTPSAKENAALARVLLAYHERGDVQWIAPLMTFLEQFPQSSWRASLLMNVATLQRQAGAFAGALATADSVWEITKDRSDPMGRAVADLALAESLTIAATFGQSVEVMRRLRAIGARDVRGPAGRRVARAREMAAMITSRPDGIIASGPEAVRVLWALQNGGAIEASGVSRGNPGVPSALRTYVPTAAGTSLTQVAELAKQSGLRMRMVTRVDARDIPVPAILHWQLGHFSAVVERQGDRYRVQDVALGGSRWVSRDTLLSESSGYWLIPAGTGGDGWAEVGTDEASRVIGHSCPPGGSPPAPPCNDACCCGPGGPPPGGGGGGPGGPPGMPVYTFNHVTASLILTDQPTTYTAPRGPDVTFRLSYNHREELQPQIFTYANLGPMWTFPWARFVHEQPMVCGASCDTTQVWVQTNLNGREVYSERDAQGVYPAHWSSRAVLVRTSASPIRYERRLADGSVEVYGQSDAAPAGQRRVFLTQIIDPQGLTITLDAQLRVVAVTDAIGQVTTLDYTHPADPLKVTSVSDPYGRTATFTYTPAGQLASITDTLGLRTTFAYAAGDFISAMRTPYGVTSFRHEWWNGDDKYTKRFIEATDPLGGTEHVEFRWQEPSLASTAPASEVPTGFSAWNARLEWYNTFYWDKRAWALGANDLSKAAITHWMIKPDYAGGIPFSAPVAHSTKKPLEGRVWYKYPDQLPTAPGELGSFKAPTVVARVLDDGTSQIREYGYNLQGQMTLARDPLGRETTYEYATNGIDLVATRQKNGGSYDLLETRGNYIQHRPQSSTDASGQTTTLTYNSAGQLLAATNAKSETTTYSYDPDGRLLSVAGPVSGATTAYTYDGYGRVRTVTDPDTYTTTTDYDVFDRPTQVTYPDGTTEATTYDRLDVATRRDRRGRVTRLFYDALRRVTATRDPLGRTVRQEWCTCGALDAFIDANGNRTSWERDVQARVTKEIRADAREVVYIYETTTSRLKSLTDAKQQVTTYGYLADDRLQGLTFTNEQVATPDISYTYDVAYGRVATMVDGTGTTTYGYHAVAPPALGATRIATVDGPLTDDTISYGYDELGRVTTRSINGSTNTVTWTFDALGRVTTEVNVLGTFTYTYDGVTSRVATVTYPNGQTSTYSYFGNSQDHRLETIHHKYPNSSTLSKFDYTYDAVGNILTWRQQADSNPAMLWSYGYDVADQLTSALQVSTGTPVTVLKRYAYTYDPAGNRSTEQIDDVVVGAMYNNVNELVSQQPSGTLAVAGTLNEPASVTVAGQPAVVTGANEFRGIAPVVTGTNTFAVTATDPSGNATTKQYQVSNAGAAKAFTYDANGNLTSDAIRTFEWDARNQLLAVNNGTHRSEYTYDGAQRSVRVVEKENGIVQMDTRAIWCNNGAICEERQADGATVSRRVFADGEQVAGNARFFAGDHLGNVTDVSDSTAAALGRYTFDAWGRRTVTGGSDVTSVGFAGHRWAASSSVWQTLYRVYDPGLGRWISEDPSGLSDGANLFAYVGNNPIGLRDPDGRTAVAATAGRIVGSGIGGILGGPAGAVVGGIVGTGIGIGVGIAIVQSLPKPQVKTIETVAVPSCPPMQTPKKPGTGCSAMYSVCMQWASSRPSVYLRVMAAAGCVAMYLACLANPNN